jgi:hypothetical protein
MKKLITGLFAVAVLSLGISQASAHHIHRGHSGFSFGIVIGDSYGHPFWDDYPVRPIIRGCTVERASLKARSFGIRHQSIFKSHNIIKVVGIKHGFRAQISFARQPGCPVITY